MNEQLFILAAAPFEAARHVDVLPEGHRSRRLHGHSFVARLRAALPENWVDFPGDEASFLERQLAECVGHLDYRLLNEIINVPTDENIARWVRSRVRDVPGIDLVGVQSTSNEGADLDELNRAHIWRRFRFEAAHQLPNVPEGHQCGRMHGHGFEVILHANQSLGVRDMGIDFDQLEAKWAPLHAQLHLACLNDIPGLENPTSEHIARWIWDKLKSDMPELSWVTVYETVTAGCHYDGQHYRIWKERRFEAATRLSHAPEGDPRRSLHGHSYIVRLHLTAPLDELLGWTVDYGDVKSLFKPAYDQLDHFRLDEIAGMESGNTPSVLRWIRSQMAETLPQLDRIDLYESPGCGGFLQWGENGPALPADLR
ncbi:6-pyruvoyl tetrahydropterin synthase [Wenzhouxiangella sp. XN24]|nr:6-pyruvoyl tetrahydropterin synthase [Wenzhouxiangella sp. XN24]